MEYDPEMSSSYLHSRPNQQSAEEDASHDQEKAESPKVVPPEVEYSSESTPIDSTYVWVPEAVACRTGSSSPVQAGSLTPPYSPDNSFEAKRAVIGKTYYPVKTEQEDLSPRIGRTKGERLKRNLSDDFAKPEGGLKLEPFSPRRDKAGAREDSVALEECPAKRLRSHSQGQAEEA